MWKNVSICVSYSPHPPLCPDILCVKKKMIMFALRMAGVQSKMSGDYMARTVSIGNQGFERIRKNNYFYIDKTRFIKDWWESGDEVTLITRPRRFGKMLNMNMLECFFSNKYAGRADLFE